MSKIFQHITSSWSKLSEKTIFLACSGGVDSMTLLSILHNANWKVEVLHVNYQLRGKDSEQDMQLVLDTCKTLSIPCHLKRIDLQAILNSKGGNLQEVARKVRYDFFEEKRSLSQNNYIALGHHKNDQIETFFMHLGRKSGIMGMGCMPSEHHRFIRPLLPFSKEEIIQYAKENGIGWREDNSNKTNKYTRNILRNILLPELQIEIPSLEESILLLIEKFQETQLELERIVSPILQNIYKDEILPFSDYDLLSENEKVELIRQLGHKARLVKELDKLRLTQKGKKINIEKIDSQNAFAEIIREDSYFKFVKATENKCALPSLIITATTHLPLTFLKNEIYVDPSKIEGELHLRKWKAGDRMQPIGMKGSKLISDIIKDAKVPSNEKKEILILEDDEKILWCVNIRCGKETIADDTTKNIWKIEIQ